MKIYASTLIFDEFLNVLLQFRKKLTKYENHYSLWGGGVKKIDDDPRAGANRELNEELEALVQYIGQDKIKKQLNFVGVFKQTDNNNQSWIEYVYALNVKSLPEIFNELEEKSLILKVNENYQVEEGVAQIHDLMDPPEPMIANFSEIMMFSVYGITPSIPYGQRLEDII